MVSSVRRDSYEHFQSPYAGFPWLKWPHCTTKGEGCRTFALCAIPFEKGVVVVRSVADGLLAGALQVHDGHMDGTVEKQNGRNL